VPLSATGWLWPKPWACKREGSTLLFRQGCDYRSGARFGQLLVVIGIAGIVGVANG
jgi:hypothetical protein